MMGSDHPEPQNEHRPDDEYSFELDEIPEEAEETEETEQAEPPQELEDSPVHHESGAVLDPIEQMPLELTVRCGNLILTLAQLRKLAPGTVLEVTGTLPGNATLCHGERVVAEGELVDVDGRLGLQLTRTALQS